MVLKEIVDAITPSKSESKPQRTILERKFDGLVDMSESELQQLKQVQSTSSSFPSGKDVVETGEPVDTTLILLDGWAFRYKVIENGKRQIVSFLLPGDFINLYAALFEESGSSIRTLTECKFATANPDKILDIFKTEPRLAALLCWSAGEHDAILAEQIIRIGRRTAFERIAHLIMELLIRLQHIEEGQNDSFEFPLTQEIIGDTLGLSVVHVNRTIKKLREEELIEQQNGFIIVKDPRRLAKVAQFDREYLERRRLPESLLGQLFGD